MYQVKIVKSISDKQINQMVSAIRAFVGQYTRDKLQIEFDGYNNFDAEINFVNFILDEAKFNTKINFTKRT